MGVRSIKGEIPVWYIWYILRTFVNATVYPQPGKIILKNHWVIQSNLMIKK
jgi:hypothetical protein